MSYTVRADETERKMSVDASATDWPLNSRTCVARMTSVHAHHTIINIHKQRVVCKSEKDTKYGVMSSCWSDFRRKFKRSPYGKIPCQRKVLVCFSQKLQLLSLSWPVRSLLVTETTCSHYQPASSTAPPVAKPSSSEYFDEEHDCSWSPSCEENIRQISELQPAHIFFYFVRKAPISSRISAQYTSVSLSAQVDSRDLLQSRQNLSLINSNSAWRRHNTTQHQILAKELPLVINKKTRLKQLLIRPISMQVWFKKHIGFGAGLGDSGILEKAQTFECSRKERWFYSSRTWLDK